MDVFRVTVDPNLPFDPVVAETYRLEVQKLCGAAEHFVAHL